jgi:hypothetical protein
MAFRGTPQSKSESRLWTFEVQMKGNMAKKDKRELTEREGQRGLTAEARAEQRKKFNAQQAYGGDGNRQGRDTELSENDGKNPQARAQSRGVKNAPKKRVPTHNWF